VSTLTFFQRVVVRRRRLVLTAAVALWALALALVGYEIANTHADGRRQLEQRFAIRADLASRFVETYAAEVLTHEQVQASAQLARKHTSERDFKAVVTGGGYQAAVLLDSDGRLLQVAPAKPSLIGTRVAARYAHLRSALAGRPAVSRVVPAATGGASVVEFAAPFDTPHGRRVFSGAFDISRSPLAAYLPSVTPIKPSAVDLVDSVGTVIASTRAMAGKGVPPVKLRAGSAPDRNVSHHGGSFRIAERRVAGTPWRMVVTVPTARLYAPLSTTGRWFAWAGLVIAAIASLLVALLVGRLLRTRADLVADIARRRVVERQLSEAQTRFHRAFAQAPIGMALVDLDGGWRQVNQAMCLMLRYSEPELLQATRAQLTHADDLAADMEQVAALIAGAADHCEMEKRFLDAAGAVVWTSVSRSLVRDEDSGTPLYFIAQVQDITERRQFEAKLSHLADHDALTGLFNRRRLEHELDRQVAYTERYRTGAALLMLDLDNFKYVNDTLGHAMGDELIVRVANLLRERLRETDIVARLGGDEFALILPETDSTAAQLLAGDLLEALARDALVVDERRAIQVSASIGIAAIEPGVPRTPAELMMNVDVAMYDAKEAGRGRFSVHDPGGDDAGRLTDTVTWAQAIRSALATDGFVLYAQPILDLRTNAIARHELLLRMIGADGEHVAPATFLYIAERFGLVQEIDAWVVRRAVALVTEQARLGRRLQLEVNLSGLSLTSATVIGTIERELAASRIDPSCLTFEITETAAIVDIEKARAFAVRIAELGCGFALDDFGAGFGSFYYLKHLPFDVLKIDGEFVRNLTDSVKDQVVVRSLARIATELGKQTVAECVEDEAVLTLLREYGVDFAQGFAIGRPRLVSGWLGGRPRRASALSTVA
jgi:diguanylate cyclase (GGDEF)-like protein/PAS domain S-box-containing protein